MNRAPYNPMPMEKHQTWLFNNLLGAVNEAIAR
jgi:hypothetical protein